MSTRAAFLRLAGIALIALVCFVAALPAQTPPPPAKRLPPAGLVISSQVRTELTAGAAALQAEIVILRRELTEAGRGSEKQAKLLALLPDVEVLHKAVDWALRYDELFDLKHVEAARRWLKAGHDRAAQLRAGTAPWTAATGTVIRGYRSKLDDSVQPYALHVPTNWQSGDTQLRRLDVVLLGRGEKRTELGFIVERERPARENDIVPPEAFVLTPYGRFCNATKFAGEVDVFEALAAVRAAYPIDATRVVVRGFSMGGASTWHLATHYPHLWAAASPGAGFAETARYAKVFASGKPPRPVWEQTLWRWYDATGYAANLFNLPVVAYSGETDPQKQAADVMAEAMATEGLKLEHLIGPNTGHKYHPETKTQLAARLAELVAPGRPAQPADVRFTTYTLRYAEANGITLERLEKHWERADVTARFNAARTAEITTRNIAALRVTRETDSVTIDGQTLPRAAAYVREHGRWRTATPGDQARLAKRPGLTGPVMDAFMDPFLFVRPTGQPLNAKLGAWVESELHHATKLWRDLFRGDVLIKDDTAVTPTDLATRHVVLWGDPSSNRLLGRMLATQKLPLSWTAQQLTFRGHAYDAAHHAPILIFPNPLSPADAPRYVVLNSGVDFRDEAYGTNSLQTAKLPDFAIVDLREPAGPRWPGRIVDAGFFDETWQ
jgi:pimeloyl-ACP methyl ester carboxylesterase